VSRRRRQGQARRRLPARALRRRRHARAPRRRRRRHAVEFRAIPAPAVVERELEATPARVNERLAAGGFAALREVPLPKARTDARFEAKQGDLEIAVDLPKLLVRRSGMLLATLILPAQGHNAPDCREANQAMIHRLFVPTGAPDLLVVEVAYHGNERCIAPAPDWIDLEIGLVQPSDAVVWKESISPDGRYGVTVGDVEKHIGPNMLVEIKTKKVLAVLASEPFFLHEGHAEPQPRWSPDGKTLLWYIDGKWGSFVLLVLRVERGAVKWQAELREPAIAHALAQARKAQPALYERIKKNGAGDGSWWRDGFAVDVRPEPDDAQKSWLPMKIAVSIDANPKQIADEPNLVGNLAGTLAADGKLKLGKLAITFAGTTPAEPN
jgi:hypothetical protein